MYKLIACDIDGTLVTDDKKLTQKTIDTIRKISEQGVIFALSTGRPKANTNRVSDALGVDTPFIVYNGSRVCLKDNTILFDILLEEKDARKAIDMILANKGSVVFYSDEKLYVNRIDEGVQKYIDMSVLKPIIFDYDEINFKNITKVIWVDADPDKVKENYEYAKDIMTNTNTTITQPFLLEFLNKKISKAFGIDVLCKHYGIELSEVIAIGDALNDIEMIEHAGLGVAMANSMDGVKEHANYVTKKTNNEDGVVEVIEKFILNK